MADLDAHWESLLRTELEGDDASVARTLDTVGRLLLECVCRIRPAGVDADEHAARRPYRRFRAHAPTSDDERADDEENRLAFSPNAVPSGAPLTSPARLNAHETLAELTASAATEERSGELVLRLLAADVRFLIHPVVALNIAEWHRVIRAGRHRELSTHAPLSEEAARDLVDGLAQILARGRPPGRDVPDRDDFRYQLMACRATITSLVHDLGGPEAEWSGDRVRSACEGRRLPLTVADALIGRKPSCFELALDEVIGRHYAVGATVARRWRKKFERHSRRADPGQTR